MSIVGDVKGVLDLLTCGWTWFQDRRDPVRAQAQRLVDAFDAHGIPQQQIARVLASELAIPSASLSNAGKLKDKISPAALDWASEYLSLNRRWLDGVDPQPHQRIDGYKNESVYAEWLRHRLESAPDVDRRLLVWTAEDPVARVTAAGPLCMVYAEDSAGLDGGLLSRYWLLSEKWPIDHRPCVISMLKVVEIMRLHHILVVGRLVPASVLRKFEAGSMFAPQVEARTGKLWYPEDMRLSSERNAP